MLKSKKVFSVFTVFSIIFVFIFFSLMPATAAPYKNFKIGAGKTVIEAEDFDTDDFYNITNGSTEYRSDGAQTERCANYERDDAPDDNYNIGWSADGEWVQYTVNVEKAGKYKFEVWLASEPATGGVEIFYDDKSIGSAYAEESFGWQDWFLYNVGQVDMTAGKHIIKVEFTVSVNLDAIVMTLLDNNAAAQQQTVESATTTEEEPTEPESTGVINAGYASAEDLSYYETLFMFTVILGIIAGILACVAAVSVFIAVKTVRKYKK